MGSVHENTMSSGLVALGYLDARPEKISMLELEL